MPSLAIGLAIPILKIGTMAVISIISIAIAILRILANALTSVTRLT